MQIQLVNIPDLSFDTTSGVPATPPAGQIRLYIDPSTLVLSFIDEHGTTGTIGGGAPVVSLTLIEGSAPASPPSGDQTVYIDISDHHIKTKNSSGTVVDIQAVSSATPQLTATNGSAGTGTLPSADDHVHRQGAHDHASTVGHGGNIPASSVTGLPAISSATPQPTAVTGAAGTGTAVSADDHAHQQSAHDHATTAGHGGHIPASSVTGLTLAIDTDVVLTSPANGDVLTYDSGTSKWVNQALPADVDTLAADTDVVIATPLNNQVLTYETSSGKWKNKAALALSSATPAPVAAAGAAGSGTAASKDDHVHASQTFRLPHSWSLPGPIAIPSGVNNVISGFYVPVPTGQVVTLAQAHAILNTGTTETVTAKVQINGVDATGFTGIGISTTRVDVAPAPVALANLDLVTVVVTAVTGSAKNLSFTVFLDYKGA